jgi:V/A-type H+-transporting ATPase subunit I
VAIEKIAKVVVAVHKSDRDALLARLQRAGLLHLAPGQGTERTGDEHAAISSLEERLSPARLGTVVEELEARTKKGGLLAGFGSSRVRLARAEFERRGAIYDPAPVLERLSAVDRRRSEIDARLKQLTAEALRLEPWRDLDHAPADALGLRHVRTAYGRFADAAELDRLREALPGVPLVTVTVSAETSARHAYLVAPLGDWPRVAEELAKVEFEPVDLKGLPGRPVEVLERIAEESAGLLGERAALGAEADAVATGLTDLKIAADTLADRDSRRETAESLDHTDSVAVVSGWVRRRDLEGLERIVHEAGTGAIEEVQPEQGEQPPVALTNPRAFRPFEMILELFSLPSPTELDPTILIVPFFILSFGLCLTDAGYGIVTALLAWLMLRKFGTGNKLIGIILWGALATIPAGAMVGGWFGDIPDRLGLEWLLRFKNSLMWFDPVKDPMKFFVLSLAFGYLHMMYGFIIEIADCIRTRDIAGAFLGQLPWFLFLNGLVATVLLGGRLPPAGRAALVAVVLLSVAGIIVFTQRDPTTLGRQALWFGIVGAALLVIGRMIGWLPPVFGLAKWVAYAVVLGGYFLTFRDLQREGRVKVLSLMLALVGLASLGLEVAGVIPGALALPLSVPFLFAGQGSRKHLAGMAWGGYALYGATSYVGVVLSYIRLMALGMVTGGVAVTINVIAWMVIGVPVAGIPLAIIVLIFGHTYNIAVNVLGAFVHTLRLNYVEFFPRFYAGGGEPFRPFREEHQFVTVK